jgi:hypothetical protein
VPGVGKTYTSVYGINRNGWVVGEADKFDANGVSLGTRGVLWHDGSVYEIPSMGLRSSGIGVGRGEKINSLGQVIGGTEKNDANGNYCGMRGFFYENGQTTFFDSPSPRPDGYAWSTADILTEDGYVLGSYDVYAGSERQQRRAFLWGKDLGMRPLDDFIVGGLDRTCWDHIEDVSSISDDGLWVCGTGVTVGGSHEALVLQFVAEPCALSLLGLGGLLALRRRQTGTTERRSRSGPRPGAAAT